MSTVAELVFKAAFGDLVQAKGVLGELKDKTVDAQKEADKLGDRLNMASKAGLAFGAAVGTGLTALIGMTAAGINYADSINEMAQNLNVSTEALSGWAYGAKMAGVSQEELGGAITKLNNIMDDAFTGGKKGVDTFERLGVSITDAAGKIRPAEDVMGDLADAFSETEDNASKAAIAADIFGKAAGPAMAVYLSQGREGIEKLNAEALRFGLIVTKEVAANADAFNDRLDQMKGAAQGIGTQIAAGLLPTLNRLGEMFTETANDTGSMSSAVKILDTLLKGVASTGIIVARIFQGVGQAIGAVAAAVVQGVQGNFSAAGEIMSQYEKDRVEGGKKMVADLSKVWDDAATESTSNAPKRGKALAGATTEAKKVVKRDVDEIAEYLKRLPSVLDPLYGEKKELEMISKAEKRPGADLEMLARAKEKVTESIMKNLGAETEEEKKVRELAESVQKLREKYIQMINPMKKYWDELIEIEEAERAGILTKDEAARATDRVSASMAKATEKTKDATETQSELMKDMVMAAEGYGKSMTDSFVNWTMGAKTNVKDMVASIIADLAKMLLYKSVVAPLLKAGMGMLPFNNGGVFSGGAPTAFANGTISSPMMFPMANGGVGLAGESGEEAIMPLRRDANGRLGISSNGGGGGVAVGQININIGSAKEEDGPAISQAAQEGVDKALRGLVQQEIHNQTRIGNSLNPMPLKAF